MQESSPVFAVAPDLLRDAASERGWPAVMKRLGLAPTEVNVRAFRLRAARLRIPVGHLRWHGGIDAIPAEALAAATTGAVSRLQVLRRLGLQPGGSSYTELQRACEKHGVPLPPRHGYRRSQFLTATDDEVRAAFAQSRSMADLLRRVGLVPRGGNYRVMHQRLERLGLDATKLNGQAWSRGRRTPLPLDERLVAGRPCSGPTLTRQLLAAGYFERSCDGYAKARAATRRTGTPALAWQPFNFFRRN